jgi:lipoate-protein ligase A
MIRPHLNPLPQGEEAGLAASEGSARLFVSLDVYYDVDSRSAAMNMAVDEALLENARLPTIRFYRWDHPALSFGYFGRYADVSEHKRDLIRRWTGGGTVFHGEDLTYSIVIPASDPAFRESSKSIYEKVHCALREALVAIGQGAELAEKPTLNSESFREQAVQPASARDGLRRGERSTSNAQLSRKSDACFANPVRADVLLDGRKIAGAAQRRTTCGLLHQGSIQNTAARNDLPERFAQALSKKIERREIEGEIVRRAQEIAAQKYGTEAWLQKR